MNRRQPVFRFGFRSAFASEETACFEEAAQRYTELEEKYNALRKQNPPQA